MHSKLSYQRLRKEGEREGSRFNEEDNQEAIDRAIEHVRARTSWSAAGSIRLRRVHIKKRFRLKIPSLKKFLRKKARVVVVSLAKVVKRLKESQSHIGDLFAGNYLFMQVTPTPLKYAVTDTTHHHHHHDHKSMMIKGCTSTTTAASTTTALGHHLPHGLVSSRYSLPV